MDTRLLVRLLGLRYRLLWAQVRSRNGKIAFFLTGYLFVVLIVVLLTAGGFGAALVSIRLGKAEMVASIVLGSFFLNATFSSVILGVGMNPAFSDAALRRYPLSAIDRLAARQLTAFLEPLWMFVLALDLGLAVGFYVLGSASFLLAAPAAVLLVIANYLLARILLSLIERIVATRAGAFILLSTVVLLSLMPALLAPMLRHNRAFLAATLGVLKYTPPFAAAAVMGGAAALTSIYWLLFLLGCGAGLAVALAVLERLPIPTRTVANTRAAWNGPCDRFAALFGAAWAPLVSKALRYYVRNNRVRYNFLFAVPVSGFLVVSQSRHLDGMSAFVSALTVISAVGFLSTAAMSVNMFGYDGPGFRRYFLLPVEPARVLHAASLVSMILSAALIPVALLGWLLFAPVHTDARMLIMLVSSAVGGLFFFQALCIWTTLFAPRRAEFTSTFGNNLSFGGNVLLIGGVMSVIFLGPLLRHSPGAEAVLRHWWALPLFLLAAAAFYLVTLRAGAAVLVSRRERLLSIMEGRG